MSDYWWQAPEETVHQAVWDYVVSLEEAQKYIHELNLRNARLYANCDLLGLDWSLKERDYSRRPQGRVTENVIASVIDTATAMIAKNQPRAKFLTDDAEFSVQRKARQLEKFMEGVFQSTGLYTEAVKVFRDAVVFGTGALHIFAQEGRVQCERVLIDEIIVDEFEAITSEPRQLHRRCRIDREVLKHRFPGFDDEIDGAQCSDETRRYTSYRRVDANQVVVIESWHLPSAQGAKDGLHTICVEGATLVREVYRKNYFPFVFYRWTAPLTGFYGQGLAEQLTGIQLRINKLNRFIEECQDLIAVPRIFLPIGAKVSAPQITNRVGAIIPYRGPKPPTFMTPQAVSPEIYSYKEALKASAFEFAGISRMSAHAAKPAGLESAVALREFSDIETQRFAIQAQGYEQVFIQAAHVIIDTARSINLRKRYSMVFRAPTFIQRIDWADVDMDDDRFQISIEAASTLSRTPAGRLQSVIEMSQAGLIDQDEARRLMGHPDLARSQTLATAAIEDIEATLEEHLDGNFSPPEPYQNLSLGLARFQQGYLKARREGAPEDILEGLRTWMDLAEELLEGSQPAPMMQTPQQSMESAGPGVPPVSGALQQIPPVA